VAFNTAPSRVNLALVAAIAVAVNWMVFKWFPLGVFFAPLLILGAGIWLGKTYGGVRLQ
jgi:hypothetical protein